MITNPNEFRKVYEGTVKKSKDKELFNYRSQIADLWRPVIKKAQEFQHINFDLENNDSTGEKKTIYITKNLRKDQPVKYEFNVELFRAGGDWECPVMYFKIEFTHDYNVVSFGRKLSAPKYVWDIKDEDYSGLTKHYVIIPGIENGNHLVKTEKGYTACDAQADIRITDKDKQVAWKWINNLLHHLVDERHEMLDEPTTVVGQPNAAEEPQEVKANFETYFKEGMKQRKKVFESKSNSVIVEKELINLALGIELVCNGEYGTTYWHKEDNHIFVCLGDSNPFSDDFEMYVKDWCGLVDWKDHDKVKVTIENECGPNEEDGGWFVFDRGKFVEHK